MDDERLPNWRDRTHLVVCKNPAAIEFLKREWSWLGYKVENGKPFGQGDALVLRDSLQEAGFIWGRDFYLKKVLDDAGSPL